MLESASFCVVPREHLEFRSKEAKRQRERIRAYTMSLLKDEQYMMRGCLKVRVEEESFERVLKGRSVLRGAKNYREYILSFRSDKKNFQVYVLWIDK